MDNDATVRKTTEMTAIVLPPCGECGAAYKPKKPVDAFTVVFHSEDTIANVLFKIERFIQRLRKRRMGNL